MRRWLVVAACCCAQLAAHVHAHETSKPSRDAVLTAAAFEQARMYRNGAGVARDSVRALSHMRSAARGGHPAAMFLLSNMLAAGEGAERDEAGARHWLQEAAQRDHAEALQQLALHIQDGTLGFDRDQARAAQLMRAAQHALTHRSRGHGASHEMQ